MIFGVPIDVNKIYGVIGIIVFGILFIKTEGSKKIVKLKLIPQAPESRTFQWASELHGVAEARDYVKELDYLSSDLRKRVVKFQEEVPEDVPEGPVYFLNTSINEAIFDFMESVY